MLPIRRLDSVTNNTANILNKVREGLQSRPQVTQVTESNPNQILLREASQNKKFSYLGKDLYKEADSDSNIGKVWFTKEIVDPKTGVKESWLVALVDDNDEIIRQVSSQILKEANVKISYEQNAQDGYGNHLYPDDIIETNEGRRGTVLSVEDEDVILVKWDEGEDYPVRLYTGLESNLGIRKIAAAVNPKNIPISPGIKSKNITMDETGGTQNAKVTIEFTDAGKGLDFYQNLDGIDTGKDESEEGDTQKQPPAPEQPEQNTKQAPQPQQAPPAGMGFPAQSSLKSTIAKMTHGGLKIANVIAHNYGFSFINEDNKEVPLNWDRPLKIGSIFIRPDNGESIRLGNYMEVSFQTDDDSIIEDIVDMLVSPKDVLKGGVGDDVDIEDFDKEEVNKGKDVEKEHSDDEDIIEDIVKDHLAEDDDYYDKLEDIEKKESSLGKIAAAEDLYSDTVSMVKDIPNVKLKSAYYNGGFSVTLSNGNTLEVEVFDSEGKHIKRPGFTPDYFIITEYDGSNITSHGKFNSLSDVISKIRQVADSEPRISSRPYTPQEIEELHKLREGYNEPTEEETQKLQTDLGDFLDTHYKGIQERNKSNYWENKKRERLNNRSQNSEPRISSILPNTNPQEQEQSVRDYANRIKSQNPSLSQKVDSILNEYNFANKADYNVNRQFESRLENLMLGIDTAASMKQSWREGSALTPNMSSQDNYDYISDYANRLREQYPESSSKIDSILTNFYSEPFMDTATTRKYESQLENIIVNIDSILSSLKKKAEFDDPSEADNWFPTEYSDFIKETLTTPDVADELRELVGGSVYNNLNKVLESVKRRVDRGSYPVSQNVINKWGYSFPLTSLQDLYFYLHQYSRYLKIRALEYAVNQVRDAVENRDQQRDKTNKATTKIHFHYNPFDRDLSRLINYLQDTYVENKDYRRDMPYSRDTSSYSLTDLIIYNPGMLEDSKLMSIINGVDHSVESISSDVTSSLRFGSANVASPEWISSHLPSNWKNAPEDEIIYHFLDEMNTGEDDSADVSYEAMKAAFNRFKRSTKASQGRFFTEKELLSWSDKTAADISDSVSPMGWTTQESNSAPQGAGPALPQQQNLQQEQPDVLYDSNKDQGPKFQTTIDPKGKSVTVKFLESEEKNQLDNIINQPQEELSMPGQQNSPNQPPPVNQNNPLSQQPQGDFSDQNVPVSY